MFGQVAECDRRHDVLHVGKNRLCLVVLQNLFGHDFALQSRASSDPGSEKYPRNCRTDFADSETQHGTKFYLLTNFRI
jgi:hypothetical protein